MSVDLVVFEQGVDGVRRPVLSLRGVAEALERAFPVGACGRACMEMQVGVGVAGHFTLEAVGRDGRRRKLADFANRILDGGLDRILTGGFMSYCRVGSGSTAVADSQTALVAQVAATNTVQASVTSVQSTAPYYGELRWTYRFASGVAAGNLTEVGVGWAATGGTLFSRALITDGAGDPTTVVVLADEYLDVTYRLRLYVPADAAFSFTTVQGTTHTGVARAANVLNTSFWASGNLPANGFSISNGGIYPSLYPGALGSVTGVPSGTPAPIPSYSEVALHAYVVGSYVRDATITWGLNYGNVAGSVQSMVVATTLGTWQFSFSPLIAKTASKILQLTVRVAVARHAA